MSRERLLDRLQGETAKWDLIVIGGGATGLGAAVEAASRGYSTLLLEQSDFAKGTSSRSTKLVHGGVRYLRQGDIALVLDALRERGRLMRNAPHLVRHQSFIVPAYDWWEGPFYGLGLKVYDLLAGDLGLGPSRRLTREETLERIPTLEREGLRGGIVYYDGQFDDARLAVVLARTLADLGGLPLNYMRVEGLLRASDRVFGVEARDLETGRAYAPRARAVINATGVYCDAVRRMDEPAAAPIVVPSQGIHIVLDRSFLPGESAVMVPHTDDGRVLFAVPWQGRVVVGTTDRPVTEASLEPRAGREEIDFLLEHAGRYLTGRPSRDDVLSVFAGLRPLVRTEAVQETATLSRDHTVSVSPGGLVTITGGKWTTYRLMGEDAVNAAARVGRLEERRSVTAGLRLHGFVEPPDPQDAARDAEPVPGDLGIYGADAPDLKRLIDADPGSGRPLHPRLPYCAAQIVWAARHEMTRTLEDLLARRLRALLLDARASLEMAPAAARILAQELGRGPDWGAEQIRLYADLAAGYLPS